MTELEALEKAVAILGGQTNTARFLTACLGIEIKQAHVWNWLNRDQKLPDKYVMAVQYGTSLKGEIVPAEALSTDWSIFYNPKFELSANDSIFHEHNRDCNYLVG